MKNTTVTSVGTCKTCKHWGDPCSDYPNLHHCNHRKTVHGFGEQDDDSMTVADGEPYNAGVLVTGPDFGCIHFEPK